MPTAAHQLEQDILDGENETDDPRRFEPASRSVVDGGHQSPEVIVGTAARHHAHDGKQNDRSKNEQREHRVPGTWHRKTRHHDKRDQCRDDDADHREGKPFQGDGRRCDFGCDAIVEKDDLERLAGDAPDRKESDGVCGEAHAQQAREWRACVVRERDSPAPGSQQLPNRCGYEDDRQRKAQTARILDATLGEVQGLLKKGDAIAFTGFGTFSVSRRKSRRGRHPRTGAPMNIPATKVPRFRAGKFLKDAVR